MLRQSTVSRSVLRSPSNGDCRKSGSLRFINNTNTVTLALPTGTAAGDTLLVLSGHGYQNNTPTPATFDMSFQTNIGFYNGGTWLKIPVQARTLRLATSP
jgi:hypothetical protein